MRYCIPLNSRAFFRTAVPTIQGGRIHATHARALATIGSRPADHMENPHPAGKKFGVERETMYIGGGLAAIAAIWYYYATVEHERIEKKRDRSESHPVDDAARSAKGRAQEALKKTQ